MAEMRTWESICPDSAFESGMLCLQWGQMMVSSATYVPSVLL